MPRPFYERLKEYYSTVGEVLRGEADAASIFPNSTDIGMSRERTYAEALRLHLPSSCNVLFGGFLFDQDGKESKQLDILITDDSSLQFNFRNPDGSGKSFACIDGCVGVVSVKSNLDSTELVNSLENIASIPDKQALLDGQHPFGNIDNYEDWPYKIIYASDGIALLTLKDSLNEFYVEHPEIPNRKRPNLIHVAGKYVIARIGPKGRTTTRGKDLEPNTFFGVVGSPDVFALFEATVRIQEVVIASRLIIHQYGTMYDKMI